MKKVIDAIGKVETAILIIGSIVTVIVVFGQVVLRSVFHFTFPWSEELARYVFIYLTWIGASTAIDGNQHISITLLGDCLPKAKKILNIVVTVIGILLSVFLLVTGGQMLESLYITGQKSVALKLPMYIAYAAIPLGGFLMCVKYTYKLIAIDIQKLRKQESKLKEVE